MTLMSFLRLVYENILLTYKSSIYPTRSRNYEIGMNLVGSMGTKMENIELYLQPDIHFKHTEITEIQIQNHDFRSHKNELLIHI